jgi:hypothetical protein
MWGGNLRPNGGNNKLETRQSRFQGADQLHANPNFAHADGVQPQYGTGAVGPFDFWSVEGKTLPEPRPPIGAAAHFEKVPRRAQPEENGEQNVVSKSHPT